MQPESTQPDSLKFWTCDFCHRGLTARDIHDITDHKVRCYTCAALGAPDVAKPESEPAPSLGHRIFTPEPEPTTPSDDDKGAEWPFDHKRQLDDCYRRAFMLYGCLVGRGSLPMPVLQSQDDCNEAQLAIDAIMEGLALIDGIPFKND